MSSETPETDNVIAEMDGDQMIRAHARSLETRLRAAEARLAEERKLSDALAHMLDQYAHDAEALHLYRQSRTIRQQAAQT